MEIEKKDKRIIKTVIATLVLLIAFFVQGAVVVMWGITGVNSALYRGGIIWTLVILTLLYYALKYKSLNKLGFVRMEKGTAKRLLFFIPLFVIAFSHFMAGFDAILQIEDRFLRVNKGINKVMRDNEGVKKGNSLYNEIDTAMKEVFNFQTFCFIFSYAYKVVKF